jgi:hypothetical protein
MATIFVEVNMRVVKIGNTGIRHRSSLKASGELL